MIDSGVREFSSEAVQQCLGWLRGGSPVRAAISRLVRAMLRFDVEEETDERLDDR